LKSKKNNSSVAKRDQSMDEVSKISEAGTIKDSANHSEDINKTYVSPTIHHKINLAVQKKDSPRNKARKSDEKLSPRSLTPERRYDLHDSPIYYECN